MTLYEIADKFNDILDSCEDMDDNELGNALFEVNAEFADKIQNCVYFVRNQEADIAAISDEIKRLQERKAVKQRKIDNIKKYMKSGMETMQRPKIEYAEFTVRIQNNPPKIEIADESIIPEQFKKYETVCKIDKKAIKEAGGCLGAEIVQEESVRIK